MNREIKISDGKLEIRCPSCNRLLARIVDLEHGVERGKVEIRRRGKTVAIVEKGELQCSCGETVRISSSNRAGAKEFRVLM